jgi:hypothetical protein
MASIVASLGLDAIKQSVALHLLQGTILIAGSVRRDADNSVGRVAALS